MSFSVSDTFSSSIDVLKKGPSTGCTHTSIANVPDAIKALLEPGEYVFQHATYDNTTAVDQFTVPGLSGASCLPCSVDANLSGINQMNVVFNTIAVGSPSVDWLNEVYQIQSMTPAKQTVGLVTFSSLYPNSGNITAASIQAMSCSAGAGIFAGTYRVIVDFRVPVIRNVWFTCK